MNRKEDVKVIFQFNGKRRFPVQSGYRPVHLIKDDYLTTGVHRYFNVQEVAPNGSAEGTITFITPEAYPHCLWVGKKIGIYDGPRDIVGVATVMEIYNPLLERV